MAHSVWERALLVLNIQEHITLCKYFDVNVRDSKQLTLRSVTFCSYQASEYNGSGVRPRGFPGVPEACGHPAPGPGQDDHRQVDQAAAHYSGMYGYR